MKLKKVWIMCGVPGSGKSTYVQKEIEKNQGIHCSRDKVRFAMLSQSDEYFSKEADVFAAWTKEINQAIVSEGPENIYVDATHLTDKSRKTVLSCLPQSKIEVGYIAFDVPLEVCLERNAKRVGRAKVPEEVIKNMYKSYKIPEGDNVIIVKE